jgi:hypothetical protein
MQANHWYQEANSLTQIKRVAIQKDQSVASSLRAFTHEVRVRMEHRLHKPYVDWAELWISPWKLKILKVALTKVHHSIELK